MLSVVLALSGTARATCPTDITIEDSLTCSSEIVGSVDHLGESLLGGSCDDGLCYTCGEPYANEPQYAPEAVYEFRCQLPGTVRMLITDLPCDLDIYVLDDTCDPNGGCVMGSTASYNVDDEVSFDCIPGDTYYIVVEAYGVEHLDVASGPCTDDGTATGDVFSPDYTLSFDVSASTGCAEDCDDGVDNDLDTRTDCEDTDCWTDAICCDLDGDGVFSEMCDGADCDDNDPNIFPGADEVPYDGVDDDCDGADLFDVDGDGYRGEDGGGTDCDDGDDSIYPGAQDLPDDGIDQDCDGEDNHIPEDTGTEPIDDRPDEGADDDGGVVDGEDGGSGRGCGCMTPAGLAPVGWIAGLGLVAIARRRE